MTLFPDSSWASWGTLTVAILTDRDGSSVILTMIMICPNLRPSTVIKRPGMVTSSVTVRVYAVNMHVTLPGDELPAPVTTRIMINL